MEVAMDELVEKEFTWVLKNFSSLEGEIYFSLKDFSAFGWKWRLFAYPKGKSNCGHLSVYMRALTFPPKWRRNARLTITVVNKGWGKSNKRLVAEGKWLNEKKSVFGCDKFLSLTSLHSKDEGYLVNDELIIIAKIHIFPHNVVPEDDDNDDDDDSCEDNSLSIVLIDGGKDKSNVVEDAETEVSNGENNDAPKGDVNDESSSSLLLNDSASPRTGSSLDQVDASVTEIKPAEETMDINGFEVSSSQVESVRHIFTRHPDIALGVHSKNQQIRRVYINELLRLIETLCQSPEKLSDDDMMKADETLVDLTDVGFKLEWLKTKLNEVSGKKKLGEGCVARIQTMEEELEKMKLMFLDLETKLKEEKTLALTARASLSFSDVVC